MAVKKITYAEPKSYFNADMKKAASKWEAEQKATTKKAASPKKGK